MSLLRAPLFSAPLDPVLVSSLFGALAGLLSLLFPYFDGLALALSALLLTAWITGGGAAASRRIIAVGAGAVVAVGWAFCLLSPSGLDGYHGLALGLAGLPLGGVRWRQLPRPGGRR